MVDFHSWSLDLREQATIRRWSVRVVIIPQRAGRAVVIVHNDHETRELKVSILDYCHGLHSRNPERTLAPGRKTKFLDVSGNPVISLWRSA